MPRKCCVVMCGHNSRNCKLKRFPTDEKRATVWQSNVGRPDWERKESSSVCECHFDSTQFEQHRQDGIKKLRFDAVPLIFPTHVLVVHDPEGEGKWLSPQPQQTKENIAISKSTTKTCTKAGSDHLYAKDLSDEDLEDSIMCDNFCSDDVFDEPEKQVLSPSRTNELPQLKQNDSFDENLKSVPSITTNASCKRPASSALSPSKIIDSLEYQMKTQNSPSTHNHLAAPEPHRKQSLRSASKTKKPPDSLSKSLTMTSKTPKSGAPKKIPELNNSTNLTNLSSSKTPKTSEAPRRKAVLANSTDCSSSKTLKTSEASRTSPDLENCSIDLSHKHEVWNCDDVNVSIIKPDSPELLKDALSFLQFMLPQKWIAFPGNDGIHVALLSRCRAKAIQRSVFAPFSGDSIELYVHAVQLSNNEILDGVSLKSEPLNHDSVGSFVDRILNIVQLFSSYEVCCGVTDEKFVKEWRKFSNCVLDSNTFREENYSQTVRSTDCKMLAPNDALRCHECSILYERVDL